MHFLASLIRMDLSTGLDVRFNGRGGFNHLLLLLLLLLHGQLLLPGRMHHATDGHFRAKVFAVPDCRDQVVGIVNVARRVELAAGRQSPEQKSNQEKVKPTNTLGKMDLTCI